MATDVKTVCELEQVGTLIKLLRTTSHHGFPVVARGGGAHARVLGVILRHQLVAILAKRQFCDLQQFLGSPHLRLLPRTGPRGAAPPLTADDFMRPWFTDASIDTLRIQQDELLLYVNLRPVT